MYITKKYQYPNIKHITHGCYDRGKILKNYTTQYLISLLLQLVRCSLTQGYEVKSQKREDTYTFVTLIPLLCFTCRSTRFLQNKALCFTVANC